MCCIGCSVYYCINRLFWLEGMDKDFDEMQTLINDRRSYILENFKFHTVLESDSGDPSTYNER